MAFQSVGKAIRLKRILPDGKSVVFAFDHGIEHGPSDFTSETLDLDLLYVK